MTHVLVQRGGEDPDVQEDQVRTGEESHWQAKDRANNLITIQYCEEKKQTLVLVSC